MSSDKSSHLSEPQPPGEVAADSSQGSWSWGVMRRASILHGRFRKMTCDPGSHCGRGNAAGPGPPSPQLLICLSWGRAPSRQAPNVRAVSNSNSWRAGTLHSLPPLGASAAGLAASGGLAGSGEGGRARVPRVQPQSPARPRMSVRCRGTQGLTRFRPPRQALTRSLSARP